MRLFMATTMAALVFVPALAFAQGQIAPPTSGGDPGSGRPANLCVELVAFIGQPDAASKAAETPPQLATAVTAKKSGDTSAQPSAPGTPQNTSGLSGQVTASGPGAAGPQGTEQNKAAPTGATATASAPSGDTSATSKPTPENVQHIEKAARANDLLECRAVAQAMRRAGVVMPAPLLALSAMSPKLLDAAPRP
ncbi:hypothetical protein MBUL_01380 [Methylobacterium bullatum]|uniref:Uncharacterized protein n=1 Tax=Methylobacterium bullatum TaxID=570505 RepID=A0A679IXF3_9HYPH|nr:hypothetical protein MBUL_01380 [Methylobacterium bullatum]